MGSPHSTIYLHLTSMPIKQSFKASRNILTTIFYLTQIKHFDAPWCGNSFLLTAQSISRKYDNWVILFCDELRRYVFPSRFSEQTPSTMETNKVFNVQMNLHMPAQLILAAETFWTNGASKLSTLDVRGLFVAVQQPLFEETLIATIARKVAKTFPALQLLDKARKTAEVRQGPPDSKTVEESHNAMLTLSVPNDGIA